MHEVLHAQLSKGVSLIDRIPGNQNRYGNAGADVPRESQILRVRAAQDREIRGASVQVVRFHNVVVSVTLNGLAQSNHGSYGPVSMSDLSSAALAFAQAADAALH